MAQHDVGREPVDPDVEQVDLVTQPPTRELHVLALVSVGGAAGALTRYGAGVLWPTDPHAFPWTTFLINLVGSALLGALLAGIELRPRWAPVRPLLVTGLIGGFTTFSTFAVDNERLIRTGHVPTALAYAVATLLICAAATLAGDRLVRVLA